MQYRGLFDSRVRSLEVPKAKRVGRPCKLPAVANGVPEDTGAPSTSRKRQQPASPPPQHEEDSDANAAGSDDEDPDDSDGPLAAKQARRDAREARRSAIKLAFEDLSAAHSKCTACSSRLGPEVAVRRKCVELNN